MSVKKKSNQNKNLSKVQEEIMKAEEDNSKKVVTPVPTVIKETNTLPKAIDREEIFPPAKKITDKETIINEYQNKNRLKNLLWLIVIFFALIIFIMWAWNIYVKTSDLTNSKNESLFGSASQQIKNIVGSVGEEKSDLQKAVTDNEKADLENSLKQSLAALLAKANTTTQFSTTTSSTLNATTTTSFPTNSERTTPKN